MADYGSDFNMMGGGGGGMGINWSDPGLYTAGAGTGLGVLGMMMPYLMGNPGAFQAKQAQRQALAQQQQAMTMAGNKEAQAQALAAKPMDPSAYYGMLTGAGTDALKRQYMANAVTGGANLDPQTAERTWLTEKLPLYSSGMMGQALGYAGQDRSNQLQAMMWNPQIQAMMHSYGLGLPMQYAELLQKGAPKGGGGDVSALGSYFQNQSMQRNQANANAPYNQMMMAMLNARSPQPGQGMQDYTVPRYSLQSKSPLGTAYGDWANTGQGGMGGDQGTAQQTYSDLGGAQ